MTFAEQYAALASDPARDDADNPLYLALAMSLIPNGTAEEWEALAVHLAPPDLPLLIACSEIEAEGGAA